MKLKTVLLSSAAAALIAGGAHAAGSITAVSWGGAYTKSQVEAYHKPWTAKTGNTIVSEDYSGGLAEVKAQVDAGNVTWDIIDLELADAVRGCDEGLFEEIDASELPPGADGTPATEDFIPGAITDCAVANIVWSTIFAYDSSVLGDGGLSTMSLENSTPAEVRAAINSSVEGADASTLSIPEVYAFASAYSKMFPASVPTSIADFYNLEKFPGKRGMRKTPKANLEMALMADGVAADDVYAMLETEEGIDRAFAKMATIKDSVVWWEAGAQPPQLLADGEVVMTTAYNGRIFNAVASEEKPFEIVWDSQIFALDLWAIVKGAPNKDLAMDFLKFSTETEQLAAQASWISYGPARKSSAPFVTTFHNNPSLEMGPQMPTAPENFKTALSSDFEFWADNQDELNERFNAWLAN